MHMKTHPGHHPKRKVVQMRLQLPSKQQQQQPIADYQHCSSYPAVMATKISVIRAQIHKVRWPVVKIAPIICCCGKSKHRYNWHKLFLVCIWTAWTHSTGCSCQYCLCSQLGFKFDWNVFFVCLRKVFAGWLLFARAIRRKKKKLILLNNTAKRALFDTWEFCMGFFLENYRK